MAPVSSSLYTSIPDVCVSRPVARTHPIPRIPITNSTPIGTSFSTVMQGTTCQRTIARKATTISIRCEQGTKKGNGLDVWLGRLAMVGFAVSISVEISTGKRLLENFGLTSPLPTVALAVTALVVVLTANFIFQSASDNMGVNLSRRLLTRHDIKILMVGLDASGKTKIVHRLMLGESVATVPTIGFNVEAVKYKNISFTIWDLGGQDKIRPLWRHYYRNTRGLIFVVDSNDRGRISEGRYELYRLLSEVDELSYATLLVFANKQDLPHAMCASEVADNLGLHTIRQRRWFVQGTSANTGQGLYEGLHWLHNNIPGMHQ